MSDISIRFDGLILGASLALAALIYMILAVGFAFGALGSAARRVHLARIAGTSAAFAIVSIIGVGVTAAYIEQRGSAVPGPDWIDWLTLPAMVLFAGGCWQLTRLRRN
jgi:hypothetical protein